MFKTEVQNQVEIHYEKLVELGYNMVGVFLYGSQNYELDYEKSDVDTKAIVLPTLEDIVLNRQPVSTTVDMGDNCLCDVKDIRMALEKYKALTHPYPSIKEKIDKYGYDNKQLHHILRLKDFVQRYCNGEVYRQILIPTNREELLRVKSDYIYSLLYYNRHNMSICTLILQGAFFISKFKK